MSKIPGHLETLNTIIQEICKKNPFQKKSLIKHIKSSPETFLTFADDYLKKYIEFIQGFGYDLDFIVDSYLMLVKDIFIEQTRFLRNGKYRYATIEEVDKNVYSNKKYMFKYMIGVALSQFLWKNHRELFLFFRRDIKETSGSNYLEIGPGHGLFFIEAVSSKRFQTYTAVDISKASLVLTKSLLGYYAKDLPDNIRLIQHDINNYQTDVTFDYITMGEVLEHLADPQSTLKTIAARLTNNGRAYISTCANCPVMDHIYLYRTTDEIRMDIEDAGLEIVDEMMITNDDIAEHEWEEKRVNVSYACVSKRN